VSNQGLKQASIRAVTGTAWDYNGDWHALFNLYGVAAGDTNGRMLAWINAALGTSYTELNGAQAAYAISQGARSWGELGTFTPDFALYSAALRALLVEASTTGLVLDFANNVAYRLGTRTAATAVSGFTYTRSGSAYDLAGSTLFGANVARRTSAGLLVEAGATNLCLQSQNQSAWTNDNGSTTSTTAPDGSATACVFTENTSNTPHRWYTSATVSSGATVTWSVFLAAGTRRYVAVGVGNGSNYFSVRVDTQNWSLGATQSVGTGAGTAATITSVGNGFYRISVTGSIAATTSYFLFVSGNLVSSGDIGEAYTGTSATIVAWGAQLETGSTATSYIPTTTASASRGADAASITGLSFSGAHSVIALTGVKSVLAQHFVHQLDDGTTNNRSGIYRSSTVNGFALSGGVTQMDQSIGATWTAAAQRAALRVATNDGRGAVDGVLGAADATLTLPVGTLSRLNLGHGSDLSNPDLLLKGLIQLLAILPRALVDGELTGATS